MKKAIMYILVFGILFSMTACKTKEEKVKDTSKNDIKDVELNKANDEKEDMSKQQDSIELERTFKVPMEDIYIDAPGYQEIEQGYTELFIVHESRYVAITPAYDSAVKSSREAYNEAFSIFSRNMQNYEGGVNHFNITTEEEKNINGMDVYFFEGTINYGTDNIHDGYAVGYAFIMDGIPCQIIGSVIDEEQPAELIAEIEEIVEAMMQSVRSEP